MDQTTAQASVQQNIMSVLARDDVPPLKSLHRPHYLRELRTETVEANGNHLIVVTIPKRGYGTYKRRSPRNKAIPPEVDVKQLEAVFSVLLPAHVRVVAVRNALENIKLYVDEKENLI